MRVHKNYIVPVSLFAFLFLVLSIWALPASAQQDSQDRLNRLENEIQTLSRAVFRGEMPPAGSISSGIDTSVQTGLEVRLTQLESDVRELTGKIEEQSYEQRRMKQDIEKIIADIEMRLMEMESRLSGRNKVLEQTSSVYSDVPGNEDFDTSVAVTPATSPPISPAIEQDEPETSEQQLGTLVKKEDGSFEQGNGATPMYEHAFSLLKEQDFDEAEKAFVAFLEQYPDHTLAPNAQYWLGESFYVRNDYERAARVFAEGYQKYPEGAKGPDNLLKLGLSLAGLGKKNDACLTLKQLKKQYGNSGANPVLARTEREMEQLSCTQ